ncbi:hypothetical protein TUMSATVNIG1_58330 (plasmid) [Vibrio nigripulchritudo]|uniref:type-F conjugative transfer system secretin TraK n=1 Tax=Vibrio nigripulchritudo TaxID=28173 RepID=UPI0019095528|nr:hypothetical protein VNTUMSATTG_57850 [Vibrio nigripulchritudo]BDU35224.1 hypothetical protein TUMSATVNIG1_58330 [Vibrio nigripulchritudo]
MKTAIHCCFASLMISFGTGANNVPKTVYPFNDGDTVPISLSSININRLMVADDRIINLTCPRGFCTTTGHQKDKSGSISLKLNLDLPFSAHLTTEKGKVFAVFITPKATPAVVSEFVATDAHRSQPTVFDREFDYPTALVKFTEAMMRWQHDRQPIAGFQTHQVDPDTLPPDASSLAVIPKTVFVGQHYSGIVYEVHNRSSQTMALTTAQFYSPSARSAALDALSLEPDKRTHLYVVTGGGIAHVR